MAWWFLGQVHGKLVEDYVAIGRYYLEPTDARPVAWEGLDQLDESLLFVDLAKAGDAKSEELSEELVSDISRRSGADGGIVSGNLTQLRRRYFFKLLERCDVEIAQGKGSEIKLLRKKKRPFRLGNHYGMNPMIPAFLAAAVLKRLEITLEEWMDAIAAG